jgi:putative membrane protein
MNHPDLGQTIKKNDKGARTIIAIVSLIVFSAVVLLSRVKLELELPFNVHVFATFNAVINSVVSFLLLAGLYSVKQKNYLLHKKIMMAAIICSALFLLSYIAHHLLAGDTKYGDINHDGILSLQEEVETGNFRKIYLAILLTHIPLAGIILPFILFTSYRALTGEFNRHRKIAKITWPIWFYVAITGVLVYVMIKPYYN